MKGSNSSYIYNIEHFLSQALLSTAGYAYTITLLADTEFADAINTLAKTKIDYSSNIFT